jgi:GntR family transcriptional regulator of vanillate catabolism
MDPKRTNMAASTPTILQLREMILRGDLAPGERVRETQIAERLGISRMPVRQALPVLAQEGLLVRSGQRGFAVRAFSHAESLEALRLRAVLEGHAARTLAERGAMPGLLARLHACLEEGDALFTARTIEPEDELRYGDMNARLHALVLEGAQMPLLDSLAARCNVVPFTAPHSIAFAGVTRQQVFDLLFYAHRQHHSIVEAIEGRRGDRAEFLFRDHAITQEHSMHRHTGVAGPGV